MTTLLKEYKMAVYASWTSRVDEDCQINLSQPLIVRNEETNLISVNFDKRLQVTLIILFPWRSVFDNQVFGNLP